MYQQNSFFWISIMQTHVSREVFADSHPVGIGYLAYSGTHFRKKSTIILERTVSGF